MATLQPVKVHPIGGYAFTLAPCTNRKRHELNMLCGDAGIKDISELVEKFSKDIVSLLPKENFVEPFIDLILDFKEDNRFAAFKRKTLMMLRGQSKQSLIADMEMPQLMEVADDFFIRKVGILWTWSSSLANMVSSFRAMQA